MAKSLVTYLFGAGASFGRVPIVRNLTIELAKFSRAISEFDRRRKHSSSTLESWAKVSGARDEPRAEFARVVERVVRQAATHATIDTYAKKLFLRGNSGRTELQNLKIVLSIFLIWVQSQEQSYNARENTEDGSLIPSPPVDPRYDSFLATILEENMSNGGGAPQLPEHIKFLTWNYDFQLSKSYFGFSENLESTTATFGNPRRHLKINGSCQLFDPSRDEHKGLWEPVFRSEEFALDDCILCWAAAKHYPVSLPDFAWEPVSRHRLESYLPNYSDTETLIVVGYSFPYFNKSVDREILKAMPKLRNIILQGHENDIQATRVRLDSILAETDRPGGPRGDPRTDTDSFFIPNELTP